MSKKNLYIYHPETDTYEPVRYPYRRTALTRATYIAGGVLAAALLVFMLNAATLTDREEILIEQNRQLEAELKELQRRTNDAMAVMHDIADRDNNFYRVLMQAEPLPDTRRYAGLHRQQMLNSIDSMSDSQLLATLRTSLDVLESQMYTQSRSLDYIRAEAMKRKGRLDYMPAIQPIAFEDMEHLASGFGRRTDPVYGTSKMHEGMDFSAATGTPVYATAKGRISYAGWKNGYGNVIYLDHGYDYETRYGHLSQILVKEGQEVDRGQLIGRVGNTGKSTGPHLHYEVRFRDIPQNPINYYFYDMTPEQYDEVIRQAQNAGYVMD